MADVVKLEFEIKDFNILDTHNDHAIVRAKIVNVGENHNATRFSKESIEKAIPTLYNIPLIGIYNDILVDFKSHAKDERERAKTYAVGTIPESCNAHFETYNGMEYLVADIVVWKEYFPNFYEVMARNENNDKQTTISMEITLNEYVKDSSGVFDIKDFAFNGICLLGADVHPGIPNAGLRVIRFEEGEIEIEDKSLYEKLLTESNEELELFTKYSEKALSDNDNEIINKEKFEKGEVGSMLDEETTLAENLEQVVSENKDAEPTPAEVNVEEGAATEVKEEPVAENFEEQDDKEEKTPEAEKVDEGKEFEKVATDKEEVEKCEKEPSNKECDMAEDGKCEKCEEKEVKEEKVEKCEDKCEKCEEEEKPLTKSERKTYQANERAYQEKIAYLKAELQAYMPYKAMYEQAEKEIKELLEYKEEAELNKLQQDKAEYFKTFGMADFDEEDRDEIIKKINDYNFSYQDFKAFMADKVQKYGMKSRFQNITDIINMYAENDTAIAKYAEAEAESDEDKILNRYTNI